MNSLLSGLGNAFLNTQKASVPTQNAASPNILMQAIGAAMRGESPQEFMQNLATQHPQLRQIDFSNMTAAAQQVCQQNGVDMQQVINQLDNVTNSIIQK